MPRRSRKWKELPPDLPQAHREFVLVLRKLRDCSPRTQAAIAASGFLVATSLSNHLNGGRIPDESLVRAFYRVIQDEVSAAGTAAVPLPCSLEELLELRRLARVQHCSCVPHPRPPRLVGAGRKRRLHRFPSLRPFGLRSGQADAAYATAEHLPALQYSRPPHGSACRSPPGGGPAARARRRYRLDRDADAYRLPFRRQASRRRPAAVARGTDPLRTRACRSHQLLPGGRFRRGCGIRPDQCQRTGRQTGCS